MITQNEIQMKRNQKQMGGKSKKKIKDHKSMVASLKRGDEVVTSGGIIGRIERVLDDDKIDILISENVTVQVVKSTVQSLLTNTQTKK